MCNGPVFLFPGGSGAPPRRKNFAPAAQIIENGHNEMWPYNTAHNPLSSCTSSCRISLFPPRQVPRPARNLSPASNFPQGKRIKILILQTLPGNKGFDRLLLFCSNFRIFYTRRILAVACTKQSYHRRKHAIHFISAFQNLRISVFTKTLPSSFGQKNSAAQEHYG
jgi:hypothetical protein